MKKNHRLIAVLATLTLLAGCTSVPQETKPAETKPAEMQSKETGPKAEKITAGEALSIALSHAGLSKSEIRDRDVEWDDGCWEVSFDAGRTEYAYKISAQGKILHSEKEYDDG